MYARVHNINVDDITEEDVVYSSAGEKSIIKVSYSRQYLLREVRQNNVELKEVELKEVELKEVELKEVAASSIHDLELSDSIREEIGDPEMREEVYREMAELIGMKEAKEWLEKMKIIFKMKSKLEHTQCNNLSGKKSGLPRCFNLVLTGKPGTGKTTFARLVHKFLKAHGVLTGKFVIRTALELKGKYVGSTIPLVNACSQEAKGGLLFLDEAHKLNGEAVRTLLTEVENDRKCTVYILAGCRDKMKHFMRGDLDAPLILTDSVPRRFPYRINFPNYNFQELSEIANYVAKSDGSEKDDLELATATNNLNEEQQMQVVTLLSNAIAMNLAKKSPTDVVNALKRSNWDATEAVIHLMDAVGDENDAALPSIGAAGMFVFGEPQAPDESKMITDYDERYVYLYEATETDVMSCDIVSKKSKVDQMIVHSAMEIAQIAKLEAEKKNFVFEKGLVKKLGRHIQGRL